MSGSETHTPNKTQSYTSTPVDPSPRNGTNTVQAFAPQDPLADPHIAAFLHDVDSSITGEVEVSQDSRARYSTDAGLYRIPPLAVVFPQSTDDVLKVLELSRTYSIPVTNRGGGTSCSGNAIGPGIVIEYTRHLNRVLSIDPQTKTARVEPGCIESTLQEAAAQYGLRFGPDPSSQNRATIAGMIGNNACGPHATAWGRTSSNVVSLECVDGTGRHFTASTSHDPSLPEVPGLAALIDSHLAPIRMELGSFSRQVSGYSLEHLTPENRRNLASMLVGTEGTLVTILEATVQLVDLPQAPVLVALGYPNMIAAADDVPSLLTHQPLAVEGLDARLIEVVRQHHGPGAVPQLPEGQGWLLCEVGGHTTEESLSRAHALAQDAHTDAVAIYPPGDDALRLWRIRADGAGLGGRTPYDPASHTGGEQAWPGFEDAAVPPENLGQYLRDFTALMDEFSIDGLLYGHFGDGCVHIRLDFPIGTDEGVAHTRRFLERAAQVCASHGGSVSGEHGDGRARSELLRYMYSAQMLDLFAQVKGIFDPNNLLNPGVLAAPMSITSAQRRLAERHAHNSPTTDHQPNILASDSPIGSAPAAHSANSDTDADRTTVHHFDTDNDRSNAAPLGDSTQDLQPGIDLIDHFLRRPASRSLPSAGGFAFREDHSDFSTAIHRCTGVGKCRASIPRTFMCPSWKVTKDEKDVTRGRARTLQEAANGQLLNSIDSPEVLAALDLCLACKACSSDCPAGVDMAKYRSEVLFRRYRGRVRPVSHYALGWLPRWTRLSAKIPGVARIGNAILNVRALRRFVFSTVGLDPRRPMPQLQSGTFSRWAARQGFPQANRVPTASTEAHQISSTHSLSGPRDPQHRPYVVVWADSFSQTLDDRGARDLTQLLEANGFAPIIAPDVCCGLTWITTGQLTGAQKKLRKLLDTLAPFAANGIPIVGVEPSCTAVLRDDLRDLLPEDPRARFVSDSTVTLAELLLRQDPRARQLPDLSEVKIVAQPHCHHYSVMGWDTDQELLESLGATIIRLDGCCGLAGNFGMEQGHYELSTAVAAQALLPTLKEHPDAVFLADGFSCRTQAEQLASRGGVHLATLLSAQGGTDIGF